MGMEYERKFKADPKLLEALRAHLGEPFTKISMETTYYDTPDRKLEQQRCTLRSRMENGVQVCTLKTPVQDGVRGEWEMRSNDIRAAAPVLWQDSGLRELAFLEDAVLRPTCGARFTRLAKLVVLETATVEVALDRGVLTGYSRESAFAEIEVELKSGDRAAADAFTDDLAARFSLEVQPLSKFRRALALAKGV